MKKYLFISCVMLTTLLFSSCGTNKASSTENTAQVSNSAESNFDIDLTGMSSTMVYAQVNEMITTPTDFVNKSVKLSGTFSSEPSEFEGVNYYFVVIADATSCCSQGFEFIYYENDNAVSNESYPEVGAEVEISGVYTSYDENGSTYYYVKADNLRVL